MQLSWPGSGWKVDPGSQLSQAVLEAKVASAVVCVPAGQGVTGLHEGWSFVSCHDTRSWHASHEVSVVALCGTAIFDPGSHTVTGTHSPFRCLVDPIYSRGGQGSHTRSDEDEDNVFTRSPAPQ